MTSRELDRVTLTARRYEKARADLEAAMKAAAEAGNALRPIAAASGFSRERVRQLISAKEDAA